MDGERTIIIHPVFGMQVARRDTLVLQLMPLQLMPLTQQQAMLRLQRLVMWLRVWPTIQQFQCQRAVRSATDNVRAHLAHHAAEKLRNAKERFNQPCLQPLRAG
jgi:hypothetical protein